MTSPTDKDALVKVLQMVVRQNSCDMVLTGEELRRVEGVIALLTTPAEAPVADGFLHDDGHFTWNDANRNLNREYKSNFAGWREPFYLNPPRQQLRSLAAHPAEPAENSPR